MKTKRILAGVAVAVVATAGGAAASHWLLGGGFTEVAHAAAPPAAANPVDQLWAAAVTNVDDKLQSLSLLKGQPSVVNFWA